MDTDADTAPPATMAASAEPPLLAVAAALLNGLPVLGTRATLYDERGGRWPLPTLVLDCRGRPEVADLPRVHLSEPGGDNRARVVLGRYNHAPIAIVHFETPRPVRAVFTVLVPLAEHGPLLGVAARLGALAWTDGTGARRTVVLHRLTDPEALLVRLDAAEAPAAGGGADR